METGSEGEQAKQVQWAADLQVVGVARVGQVKHVERRPRRTQGRRRRGLPLLHAWALRRKGHEEHLQRGRGWVSSGEGEVGC